MRYYLYDGGSSDHVELGTSQNLTKALSECQQGARSHLNGIILSHPDSDHFNLIAKLFTDDNCCLLPKSDGPGVTLSDKTKFTGHLVLTEAFIHKNNQLCKFLLYRLQELNFSAATIVDEEVKGSHDLIKMAKCLKLYFPLSSRGCKCLVYKQGEPGTSEKESKHDKATKSIKDWNESSTILNIGNAAILTGDATAETLQFLQNQIKSLQVFQVPHHGSKRQYYRGNISKDWKYLLAFRSLVNFYMSGDVFELVRHLPYGVRMDILKVYAAYFAYLHSDLRGLISDLETQCGEFRGKLNTVWSDIWKLDLSSSDTNTSNLPTDLVKVYKDVKRVLKDKYRDHMQTRKSKRVRLETGVVTMEMPAEVGSLFTRLEREQWKTVVFTKAAAESYKKIPAKVYVISSGLKYNHPDEEVLSGIILSVHNDTNKRNQVIPVTLLVTSRVSLEEKILHLPPDFKINEHLKLVEIEYLKGSHIPSVPIDLTKNGDPLSDCRKDCLETWPWNYSTKVENISYGKEVIKGDQEASQYSGVRGNKCEDEDPSLSEYLKVVAPSHVDKPASMSFSSILKLLVGPQLERQLSLSISLAKGPLEMDNLAQTILQLDVKEESEFVLSGATNHQTAKSAKLNLHVPPSTVKVMGMDVQAITVEVENAKCPDTSLKVDFNFNHARGVKGTLSIDYSEVCKDSSSIGRPLTTLLSDIGSQSEASTYTVGTLLGLILGVTKAEHLIRLFPIKLSSYLATWNVNLPHTVIDFETKDSLDIRGAFIVSEQPSQLCSISLSSTLQVQLTSMEMKFSLMCPHTVDGVDLRGDCYIVKSREQAIYRALSISRGSSMVEIEFMNRRKPSDLLEYFDASNDDMECDHGKHIILILGKELEQCTVVSSSLIVEQPATYCSDTRITSAFFELDPKPLESDIMHLLPQYLQQRLKLSAVRAVCTCPPDFSLLGIESVFTCETLTHTELKLQILPLTEAQEEVDTPHRLGSHSYNLTLRPVPMPYSDPEKRQKIVGPSVLAIVETFSPQSKFKDALLSAFPMIKSVLDSVQLRYFYTELNPSLQPLSVRCFDLKLYIPRLDIISEKLTIESADIDLFFSEDYNISISSYCRITVLKEHTCMVNFSLPTQEKDGHFSFRNYSNALTLSCVLDGFDFAESLAVSQIPVLSTVLDITIKSISLIMNNNNYCYTITEAGITIYKSEIEMGSLMLSEVELTALYSKGNSLSFSVQGFVGETLFATLSYDSADSMLSGGISTSNIAGKQVKLSLFLSFIGLPDFNVPSKLGETFSFMDLEVQSASICLKLATPICIESLTLRLRSDSNTSLELMSDPKIVLEEIELTVEYKSDSKFKVIVRGSITIANVVVTLEGEVNKEGMTLKGRVEQPFDFIKAIDTLKPIQSQSLAVPEFSDNYHDQLSSMRSIEFLFREQKNKTDIMVACDSSFESSIDLGGYRIALQSLGAKLCVTNHENVALQYSGYVCSCFSVCNFQVDARLALVPAGKTADIVFIGLCKNLDSLSLKMLSNSIEGARGMGKRQQQLVPNYLPDKVSNVAVENIVLAVNVTKKQLFFYLKVKDIGNGLVMLSFKNSSNDYIIGFSLPHGYKLQQISDVLAPIDQVLLVRELHFLVVAMDSKNLNDIISTFHEVTNESNGMKSTVESFDEAKECAKGIEDFQSSPPLATVHPSDTNYVRDTQLKRGFYVYCKLDLVALRQSDSIFCNVVQLSEDDFPDIMMSMYIGQGGFEGQKSRELSITAYIPKMRLFGEITFNNVYFEYQLANESNESEAKLSGDLKINLGQSDITIKGSMHVLKRDINFSVSECTDSFSSPLEFAGAMLQNIQCGIEIEREKQRTRYEVKLAGSVKFSKPSLTFNGSVIFKDGRPILLAMTIEGVLKLTDLVAAAFGFEGSSTNSFVEIEFREGHLVYARQPHMYMGFNVKKGLNAMSTLVVMKREFKITATFTKDPVFEFMIEGHMVGGAIDILGLVELKDPKFKGDSVVLGCSYSSRSQEFKLFLSAGVVLLGKQLFSTVVQYSFGGVFEGKVKCAIEYIAEMTIEFKWSKQKGFEIVKWPAAGDFPVEKVLKAFEYLYDFITAVSAFMTGGLLALVSWLAKYIVKKCLKFKFEMDAKLNENPDSSRYRVAIGLKLTFVVKLIGTDIFRKDIMEVEVKIGKKDTLKHLPKRIWEAFVDWFKQKFSDIFSKPSDDNLAPPTAYLPDVSSLSQFDKHFETVTQVVHSMTVIRLSIKANDVGGGQQKKKEKLQALLSKNEKWLNDHNKFINLPCMLKSPPVVVLYSPDGFPVQLRATWCPPLEDDDERYSYDIRIRTEGHSGTTEIVNTITKPSYECDDPKIAEASLISFEIRCIVKLSAKVKYGKETISSDEEHILKGDWSKVTVLNETKQHTEPDTAANPDPPTEVTVELTNSEGTYTITGSIFLSDVPQHSNILIQLLNGDSVLSSQPTTLSVGKEQKHTLHFGFNVEEIPSDASGPFSVQAQVLTCIEGSYKKSDMTRSKSYVSREETPKWTKFQYNTNADRVYATVKCSDKESQCTVEVKEHSSTVLDVSPVDSHLGPEGERFFFFNGTDIRDKITDKSSQIIQTVGRGGHYVIHQSQTMLTCSAQVKGTKTKLCSCPSLSSPLYVLPPPTGFKCLEGAHSKTVTCGGSLKLVWDPPKGVTLCCVGLIEESTSYILQLVYAANGSCTVELGGKQALTFKCFVFSCGNEMHINSKRVYLDRVFIHLPTPSIRGINFDHSAGKLSLDFKGDRRASHFLLKSTISYHLSNPISLTKEVEQRLDSAKKHHGCLVFFDKATLKGCKSIRVSLQAIGRGSLISSQCGEVEGEDCTAVVMCKYSHFCRYSHT